MAIAPTGSVLRTTGHVVGRLQKAIPAGGAFAVAFEVGDLGAYAPVSVSWSAVSLDGTLTVAAWPGDDPGLAAAGIDPAASLNRWWTLELSGLGADPAEGTLHYQAPNLDGSADPAALVAAIGDGSGWVLPPVIARTDTSLTVAWTPGPAVTMVAGMAAADLALSLAGPATLPVGGTGTYAIGVTNTGPLAVGGVTVSLSFPAAVVPGAATPSQGSCMVATGLLTCDLGPMAAGAAASVSVDLTIPVVGEYVLEANASVSGASDPDQTDNVTRLTVGVRASPAPTPEPTATPTPSATPASSPGDGLPNTRSAGPSTGSADGAAPWALAALSAMLLAVVLAPSMIRGMTGRRARR